MSDVKAEAATVVMDEPELRFRFVGERGPVFAALAKSGLNFQPIVRDRKVRVRPKDTNKAEYEFAYAPLENLVDATRKPLADNELVIMQPYHSTRGGWLVRTILGHSSGAYIEAVDFIQSNERMSNQDFGGVLSFRRRYAYGAILGLVTEEDDDANAADGNAAFQIDRQRAPTSQQRGSRGQPTNSKTATARARQNFGPPPGWPDHTTVEQMKQWIDGLPISVVQFKVAWGILFSNDTLRFNAIEDWEPVLDHFKVRVKQNAADPARKEKFLAGMSEGDRLALFAEVKQESDRVELDKQSRDVFSGTPENPTAGTESHEPANQAN